MKITDTDYDKLSRYLETGVSAAGVEYLRDLRRQKLGKDVERRFAFDLLHIAQRVDRNCLRFICDDLYEYLNDDHIYTALKHFVINYPALTV